MIFITGDCHGDYRRFRTDIFIEQKEMTKDDFVIVCGDFGLWDESGEQKYWRKWLSGKPFTTLWVDGNHENYDLLNTYPVERWKGGKVQFITPDIIHLMRGQIFDIDGIRFFTFGGARSHDISGGILELDDPVLNKKRRYWTMALNHTELTICPGGKKKCRKRVNWKRGFAVWISAAGRWISLSAIAVHLPFKRKSAGNGASAIH